MGQSDIESLQDQIADLEDRHSSQISLRDLIIRDLKAALLSVVGKPAHPSGFPKADIPPLFRLGFNAGKAREDSPMQTSYLNEAGALVAKVRRLL